MKVINKKNAKVIEMNCIFCEKPFLKRKINTKINSKAENIRKFNSKTCSKECSRKWEYKYKKEFAERLKKDSQLSRKKN